MNVQPGDFARVVGSEHGNEGRTCYVNGPGYSQVYQGITMWGWEVTLLEPSRVFEGEGWATQRAGTLVWACDRKLRRIEPPGDVDEVFRVTDKPKEELLS